MHHVDVLLTIFSLYCTRPVFCFVTFSPLLFVAACGEGGGGGVARLLLFVIFSLFSRPRTGLATVYCNKVVFQVGDQ